MKKYSWLLIVIYLTLGGKIIAQTTFCNPMNLSYRFRPDTPSRREAADPMIVLFQDKYFLFASKSGGYWVSDDLKDWKFITNNVLPWEDYAPSVVAIDNALYFLASEGKKIYKSTDPINGNWEHCGEIDSSVTDPCLFLDDDKKLYLYFGCSNKTPTKVVELDMNNRFHYKGASVATIFSNKLEYGFEVMGDSNTDSVNPWIEGSWMTKYAGKYYLQFATPGTQCKSYCDGVYVADKPLGPFVFQESNPVSYKPQGFIAGAGHSGTFQDKYGNYWHIATMTISKKHAFERRLGLFPTAFDADGIMRVYTGFGDYPYSFPTKKESNPESFFKGWMLLSYNKPVTVSSTLDEINTKPGYAVNEEIRDWWSAKTGNKGEFITIDLQEKPTINAIQINFADVDTKTLGRPAVQRGYQYLIESSDDNKTWSIVIDKSTSNEDLPHPYFEMAKPIKARYIRVLNVNTPDGKFAIFGFRIFGKGTGKKPEALNDFQAKRDDKDGRIVKLSWNKVAGATGYNIRYGIAKDKLYQNYIVYGNTEATIRSLVKSIAYWFTIDVFDESGVSKSNEVKELN
jgi:hypothetical protein